MVPTGQLVTAEAVYADW